MPVIAAPAEQSRAAPEQDRLDAEAPVPRQLEVESPPTAPVDWLLGAVVDEELASSVWVELDEVWSDVEVSLVSVVEVVVVEVPPEVGGWVLVQALPTLHSSKGFTDTVAVWVVWPPAKNTKSSFLKLTTEPVGGLPNTWSV